MEVIGGERLTFVEPQCGEIQMAHREGKELPFGMLAIIASLLSGCQPASELPSDAAIVKHFQTHRARFEVLANSVVGERAVIVLTENSMVPEAGMAAGESRDYTRLIRELGVLCVSVVRRGSPTEDPPAELVLQLKGCVRGNVEKGLMYSRCARGPTAELIERAAYGSASGAANVHYRSLGDGWYLYLYLYTRSPSAAD